MEEQKEFSKIELLFMEGHENETISYEEFAKAGWSRMEYLTYLKLCEEVRATVIFLHNYHRKIVKDSIPNVKEWKKQMFQPVADDFVNWLSQYFTHCKDFDIIYDLLEIKIQYGLIAIYTQHGSEEARECYQVLISNDDFRYLLESMVAFRVLNAPIKYRKNISTISLTELKAELDLAEQIYLKNQKPTPLLNMNHYSSIQEWASKYHSFTEIESEYSFWIDELQEEYDRRVAFKYAESFDYSENDLYIYCGHPKCSRNHAVIDVTAIIPNIDGTPCKINVHYCKECKIHYITKDEYDAFMEENKMMLIQLTILDDEEDKKDSNLTKREKYSKLRLCGYNVSKLTESERHQLLSYLLDLSLFTKAKILNHLEMLIHTNGISQLCAREKWMNDYDYVIKYKINEQRRIQVRDVISRSRKLIVQKNE